MRLDNESHERIETFLRAHCKNPALGLPRMTLHSGALAHLVTRVFKILAITFGRRILVSPDIIKRDAKGLATIEGSLIAHEAVHVLQYEREGYVRFFYAYLYGFWRALRVNGGWDAKARLTAYLAIAEERAAREAEEAYAGWCEKERLTTRGRKNQRGDEAALL